jgi:hypothetical protein
LIRFSFSFFDSSSQDFRERSLGWVKRWFCVGIYMWNYRPQWAGGVGKVNQASLAATIIWLIRSGTWKGELGMIQIMALGRDFQLGSAGLGDGIASRNDLRYC